MTLAYVVLVFLVTNWLGYGFSASWHNPGLRFQGSVCLPYETSAGRCALS